MQSLVELEMYIRPLTVGDTVTRVHEHVFKLLIGGFIAPGQRFQLMLRIWFIFQMFMMLLIQVELSIHLRAKKKSKTEELLKIRMSEIDEKDMKRSKEC